MFPDDESVKREAISTMLSPEFEALTRALLELAAGRPADFVDRTRVRALAGAEVDARPVIARRERDHPEVSGLDLGAEIVAAAIAPSYEILRRDQDAAVVTRPAARAAGQAVELVGGEQRRVLARPSHHCHVWRRSGRVATGPSSEYPQGQLP